MKNRVSIVALALAVLAAPLVGRAQGEGTASKVGVIAMQAAIGNTQEGKKAFADLQKKYQPRRDELTKQQQEIAALQDQLQKGTNTLSDDEQRRITRDLDDKNKIFKRTQEDAQADFQADSQEVINRIGQKMVKLINDYAKQGSFSVVLDDSNPQVPFYYVAPGTDLTEEMVKRYDAAYPVTTADASKPAGPAEKPAATTKKP